MVDALYARQEMMGITPPRRVAVIGCGGTGTYVAYYLAMVGTPNLCLFDHDVLELSNLARLPFRVDDVGKAKTAVLQAWLTSLRGDCNIELYGTANDVSLEGLKFDYLFDCTDARETQRFLVRWCKAKKIPYVRVGYNGEHFTVDDTISSFRTDLPDEHGYTVFPSYAPSTALPALLAVDSVCRLHRIPKISTTITAMVGEAEKL